MANGTWNDYLLLLGKVTKALEQLTEVEKTKTNAVTAGDLAAVEQCMKQEQVASLNLRGLDQKREKLLDQLGILWTTAPRKPGRRRNKLQTPCGGSTLFFRPRPRSPAMPWRSTSTTLRQYRNGSTAARSSRRRTLPGKKQISEREIFLLWIKEN